MGTRFRKSLKIAPGVRMNFGKRGPSSISAGGFNFGKRGVHRSFSIPGTGISYRSQIVGRSQSKPTPSRKQSASSKKSIPVQLSLQDDGSVTFADQKGNPLPDNLVREAKKQNRETVLSWLQEQCDKYNAEIDLLLNIHLTTPAPSGEVFVNPKPTPPEAEKYGCLANILSSYRQRVDERNRLAQENFEKELSNWEVAEQALRSDIKVMEAVLTEAFESIEWPRETLVSFDIVDDGQTVLLDVDLPEIEDMPTKEAQINARDLRLKITDRSQTKLLLDYLTHIHAIGFRFIGDVFAYLPSVTTIVFSGYSQRVSSQLGHIVDEYLYSVRVSRAAWQAINFSNLESIDVAASFDSFELRRKATKRGVLSAIEPFTA
jgi:hypothetical protein